MKMYFHKIGIIMILRIAVTVSYHEELTEFCHNNGMKFLSFWIEDESPKVEKFILKRSFGNDLRSRIVDDLSPFTFLSLHNIDTLIFISNKYQFILEAIHEHKIQKSILVMGKNELITFQNVAKQFAKNCYFYVLQYDSNKTLLVWYSVMILNDLSDIIMNKIDFDQNGKIYEDYNLHRHELVGTTLPWMPFIGLASCNEKGRSCKSYGILVDMIEMWSKDFNFTWDVFAGYPSGDWGMAPVSGKFQNFYKYCIRKFYHLLFMGWPF